MFVVSEAEAAAIRGVFHQQGEFAAAMELRRLFPGIPDSRAFRTLTGERVRTDDRSLETAAQATTPDESARRQELV